MNLIELQEKVAELISQVEITTTDESLDLRVLGTAIVLTEDTRIHYFTEGELTGPDTPLGQLLAQLHASVSWLTHPAIGDHDDWRDLLHCLNTLLIRKAQSPKSDFDYEAMIRGITGLLAALLVNTAIKQWHPEHPVERLAAIGSSFEMELMETVSALLAKHDPKVAESN